MLLPIKLEFIPVRHTVKCKQWPAVQQNLWGNWEVAYTSSCLHFLKFFFPLWKLKEVPNETAAIKLTPNKTKRKENEWPLDDLWHRCDNTVNEEIKVWCEVSCIVFLSIFLNNHTSIKKSYTKLVKQLRYTLMWYALGQELFFINLKNNKLCKLVLTIKFDDTWHSRSRIALYAWKVSLVTNTAYVAASFFIIIEVSLCTVVTLYWAARTEGTTFLSYISSLVPWL